MKTFLENIFIALHTGYTPKFHLSNVFKELFLDLCIHTSSAKTDTF